MSEKSRLHKHGTAPQDENLFRGVSLVYGQVGLNAGIRPQKFEIGLNYVKPVSIQIE